MEERQLLYLDELDRKGILKDLFQKLWIMIPAVILAVLLVRFTGGSGERLQYTSEASLVTLSKESSEELSKVSVSAGMADALSQVFSSDVLKNRWKSELGYEPRGILTVSWTENTNVVQLKMTAESAEEACKELRALLDCYEPFSNHIFSKADVVLLSEPSMPQWPSGGGNSYRNEISAALAVMLIGACFIILQSVFRKTVKTKASAVRRLHADVCGSIMHAEDFSEEEFQNQMQYLISNLIYRTEQGQKKVLMITSTAAHEGKSVAALQLALGLAKRGKRVFLIDCSVSDASFSVSEWNNSQKSKESSVDACMLGKYMTAAREQADYILLISPSVDTEENMDLFSGFADGLLLVVRHDYLKIDRINESIDLLKNGRTELMGCILNDMNES